MPEPERREGQALIEVTAAPLNPIDLAIGSGEFYAGCPDIPYVAAGRLEVEHEVLGLDQMADAWRRQADSPRRKLVLRP